MSLSNVLDVRASRLFLVLAAFLAVNAMIAEFVGVKIFALEPTLGWSPFNWNLFGQSGSLSFTSGVLLWPFVFLLTDIINEYYGKRGVRFISWLTVALIAYGFCAAYLAIALVPAEFWIGVNRDRGVEDMQAAFANIFGQGMWTIVGSITAFLIGQLIDSFVVLYIAFVLGPQQWPTSLFLAVGTVNYGYKIVAAVLMIPLIYLTRMAIRAYLGAQATEELRVAAQG